MDINNQNLQKLAKLSISRGVNLQKGQDLIITAPIESIPLVRLIVDEGYKAGANIITPFFTDPEITKSRFKFANDESFDRSTDWLFNGIAEAFNNNTARMAITGDDPMLLSEFNQDKISRLNKATSKSYKPAREKITQFEINWSIISWPGASWAKKVFPDLKIDVAQEKLADAIFKASRVLSENPILEWDNHNSFLKQKTEWLNNKNFSELHYFGPGTNLKIGLANEHLWVGGATTTQNGITCNPNMPSEEVFTTPHAYKVNGEVCSTKPLSYQGTLIEDIRVKFIDGKIVEADSKKGKELLLKVLDSDEGARRLGEVALVPHSSPISQTGITFYNTLFDENAASHIALGQCYSKCFKNYTKLSKKDIKERGGNNSMIHIDWMIGSNQIDIDGIDENGNSVPVFRKGEWC